MGDWLYGLGQALIQPAYVAQVVLTLGGIFVAYRILRRTLAHDRALVAEERRVDTARRVGRQLVAFTDAGFATRWDRDPLGKRLRERKSPPWGEELALAAEDLALNFGDDAEATVAASQLARDWAVRWDAMIAEVQSWGSSGASPPDVPELPRRELTDAMIGGAVWRGLSVMSARAGHLGRALVRWDGRDPMPGWHVWKDLDRLPGETSADKPRDPLDPFWESGVRLHFQRDVIFEHREAARRQEHAVMSENLTKAMLKESANLVETAPQVGCAARLWHWLVCQARRRRRARAARQGPA